MIWIPIFLAVWVLISPPIALILGRMFHSPHTPATASPTAVAGGTRPVVAAGRATPLRTTDRLQGASQPQSSSLQADVAPCGEAVRPGPAGDESAGPGRASKFPADIAGEGSPE